MIDNNKKLKKYIYALPTLAVLVFFPSLIFEHQPKTEKKKKCRKQLVDLSSSARDLDTLSFCRHPLAHAMILGH